MQEMLQGKKVIIFDMDGTLIDSVGIWNAVDEKLIEQIRTDGRTDLESVQEQRDTVLRQFHAAENPYLAYCAYLGKNISRRCMQKRFIHCGIRLRRIIVL